MLSFKHLAFSWHRQSILAICGCVVLSIAGCSEPRAGPVDPELARQTLKQVLNTWKEGGKIDDVQKLSPQVIVQEAAWQQGKRLVDYTLLDQGRVEDANLFCEVELELAESSDGKTNKKKVTYVIGTSPVITVFRAIL